MVTLVLTGNNFMFEPTRIVSCGRNRSKKNSMKGKESTFSGGFGPKVKETVPQISELSFSQQMSVLSDYLRLKRDFRNNIT